MNLEGEILRDPTFYLFVEIRNTDVTRVKENNIVLLNLNRFWWYRHQVSSNTNLNNRKCPQQLKLIRLVRLDTVKFYAFSAESLHYEHRKQEFSEALEGPLGPRPLNAIATEVNSVWARGNLHEQRHERVQIFFFLKVRQ